MKTLSALALAALLAFGTLLAHAQVKPNNPDGPSSEEPVTPEPPAPPPEPDKPAPVPEPVPDTPPPAPDLVSAHDSQLLVDALAALNIPNELGKASNGRTRITFKIGSSATSSMYLFDCFDGMGDCDSIRLLYSAQAATGATPQKVASWNGTEMWGRAFVDDLGNLWLDMPVWLGPGVSIDTFGGMLNKWRQATEKFEPFFK